MRPITKREILQWVKERHITPEVATELMTRLVGAEGDKVARGRSLDIAVIGMSGRFPGATSLDQFWDNLCGGVDSMTEIPGDRWDIHQYHHPDPMAPHKTNCKWAGLIPDADRFDPLFFHISPAEAERMEPGQRLFLEEAWRAIEDAGYAPHTLSGKNCGVFVGAMSGYVHNSRLTGQELDAQCLTGYGGSFLPARIAYFLNLTGPTMAIDTACSSSLVSVHQACMAIANNECEMALAGGVMVLSSPDMYIMASKGGMLSPDGRCKTFDNAANGMVPGEGVGVLVLKPLAQALADGDFVYGVIKGSRVNQDGRTNGITAPSGQAQTRLETELYRAFAVNPDNISYVEAHGTGTKLGDPIEVTALTRAFREFTDRRNYCALGSVKPNIGHGLASGGVAGLIKVLLCMQHRKLVPSIHYHQPNEHLSFDESPFYVNTKLADWQPEAGKPRIAAVSSFGLSGTNCHMVLEEAPRPEHTRDTPRPGVYCFPLAARSASALRRKAEQFIAWIDRDGGRVPPDVVAFVLQVGRMHFPYRVAVVGPDLDDCKRQLAMVARSLHDGDQAESASPAGESDGRMLLERLCPEARSSLDAATYQAALKGLATLYTRGVEIEWSRLHEQAAARRVPLPTYPFEGESYPVTGGTAVVSSRPAQTGKAPQSASNSEEQLIALLQRLAHGELDVSDMESLLGGIIRD